MARRRQWGAHAPDLGSLADPCSTAVSGTSTSNISTRYTYNALGALASMIDGRGNTTSYTYDEGGQMTGLTDGLSNTLSWSYDGLGRRTGQTNRTAGQSVTWTYDAAGRIVTRSATSVATVTYTYDLNGNRLTASDGTAITTTYDRLNRPTQVTVAGDSAATTTSTYSFSAPTWSDASGSYTATIDKFGRETVLLDPIHGATSWTSTYRGDGKQASLVSPNGNTTTWTYDDAGRATGSATTAAGPVTRASYTYTLNRAGQRLSEASSITGDPTNGTVTFTYDALGRITGYSGTPVTTQAYGWDKVPNRTSKQVGGGAAVTTTFNNANRPTSDSAGATYTNDLDGRLTGQVGQTLVWDALGRLLQVKDPITSANISTYTYDALDRLLTVSNGAGLTKFRYVGATTQIAQARDLANAVLYNVGTSYAGGALMDFGTGGTNQRFYGANGHGDLTWTGSSTGTVSATLRSDPWGIPGTSSGGSLPSFRFQGSWYDTSSALSWMITRWYAPIGGRFVSEDTLLGEPNEPASRHLLAYAAGEPVGRWDPDGHFWYRVRSGDTMKSIAARWLGSTTKAPTIFNANRNRVRSLASTLTTPSCLYVRKSTMTIFDEQTDTKRTVTIPNQCLPSWYGQAGAVTGNPSPNGQIAASTLGINWYNLTRAGLITLTRDRTHRAPFPTASQTQDYWTNTRVVDGLFGTTEAFNGTFVGSGANMLLFKNKEVTDPCSCFLTRGHIVYVIGDINTRRLQDYTIMWHEYIHVLQGEGMGVSFGFAEELVALTSVKKSPANVFEAPAYLWQEWGDSYWTSIVRERAPWCSFWPLNGDRPGC